MSLPTLRFPPLTTSFPPTPSRPEHLSPHHHISVPRFMSITALVFIVLVFKIVSKSSPPWLFPTPTHSPYLSPTFSWLKKQIFSLVGFLWIDDFQTHLKVSTHQWLTHLLRSKGAPLFSGLLLLLPADISPWWWLNFLFHQEKRSGFIS